MAKKESRLFATPARNHDAEEAEKLVEEGKVETWLSLRRRDLWCGVIAIAETCYSGRLQEKATVGIECGELGGMDGDTRCRVPVGYVYCPGAIFAS